MYIDMEVKDYEHYLIYPDGKVYNTKTGNTLKNNPTKSGYLSNCLTKNCKSKFFLNHRLVALHYLDNPNNYTDVDHIDSNRHNNNLENLRWCSRSQNNEYKKSKHYFKNMNGYTVAITRNKIKYRKWFKTEEQAIEYRDNILSFYSK